MKKAAPNSDSLSAMRAFAESDDEGAFRLFVRLCRTSPALREWLWEEFARKPKTRAKVAAALTNEGDSAEIEPIPVNLRSLRIEAAELRKQVSSRIYGGLTWSEVEGLVRHYQAGKLDLGTFLLVNEWRHRSATSGESSRLTLASTEWFGRVVRSGETRLLTHVARTLRFLAVLEQTSKRSRLFGHTDWWKLNVLFYILRHPRASYSTREFRSYLSDIGIEVGTKDIRRFCSKHGIRKDARPGRPKAQMKGSE